VWEIVDRVRDPFDVIAFPLKAAERTFKLEFREQSLSTFWLSVKEEYFGC
jgi:hypothetical protein